MMCSSGIEQRLNVLSCHWLFHNIWDTCPDPIFSVFFQSIIYLWQLRTQIKVFVWTKIDAYIHPYYNNIVKLLDRRIYIMYQWCLHKENDSVLTSHCCELKRNRSAVEEPINHVTQTTTECSLFRDHSQRIADESLTNRYCFVMLWCHQLLHYAC